MKKFLLIMCFSFFAFTNLSAKEFKDQFPIPLQSEYQQLLLNRVGDALPILVKYPFHAYPNEGHESIPELFPNGKVLVFGYGSLINRASLARSVKQPAVDTMQPAIAFGVKRIFNYKAKHVVNWGENLDRKEKAMLNLVQTLNIATTANGVTVEVDADDLANLVKRETGYDLVPILVASWDDVIGQNPQVKIQVAYTFVAAHELRNHIDYTSTEFYPVREYLHAIQCASRRFGDDFAKMWDATTYLADGTTKVRDWDEVTFLGILCTFSP
jgi:cation transport regulator ChaC